MTRKDFELIAKAIRTEMDVWEDGSKGKIALIYLAQNMANQLQGTNPRFDRERFLTACGLENCA